MTKILLTLPMVPRDLLDKVRLDYQQNSIEANATGTEKRLLSAFGLSNVLSNTTQARTSNHHSHLSDKHE